MPPISSPPLGLGLDRRAPGAGSGEPWPVDSTGVIACRVQGAWPVPGRNAEHEPRETKIGGRRRPPIRPGCRGRAPRAPRPRRGRWYTGAASRPGRTPRPHAACLRLPSSAPDQDGTEERACDRLSASSRGDPLRIAEDHGPGGQTAPAATCEHLVSLLPGWPARPSGTSGPAGLPTLHLGRAVRRPRQLPRRQQACSGQRRAGWRCTSAPAFTVISVTSWVDVEVEFGAEPGAASGREYGAGSASRPRR